MSEEGDCDSFHGRCYMRVPLDEKKQLIKAVWRDTTLNESLFPCFIRLFRTMGYDSNLISLDLWDILLLVAFGGAFELRGPKSSKTWTPTDDADHEELNRKFMVRERAFAKELINIVFNTEANLAYLREATPFREVGLLFRYQSSDGLKGTIMNHRAVKDEEDPDDTYQVTIVGRNRSHGKGTTYRYYFEPSDRWVSQRFPENCD